MPELERLAALLPEPGEEARERALRRALAALPEPRRGRRLRTAALLVAAAACLLAVAAGALAAAGAFHVVLGRQAPARSAPVSPRLEVPPGATASAAVVDGRLWLTTRAGTRIEGLPVSAAALSPHALYVAAGIGRSLVAMAPDGTRAWSHPAGGRVVAIAWAPNGLRVAYVVRRAGGFALRTIEGDGDHDRLVDAAVRPATPSWRADALALAYVGAGGRPVVYDLGRRAHRVVDRPGATRVAFAPRGRTLAAASAHRLWVGTSAWDFRPATIAGLGWLRGQVALALDRSVQLFRRGEPERSIGVPARIEALDAHGARLVLAFPGRVLAWPPRTILRVPAGARVDSVAVR